MGGRGMMGDINIPGKQPPPETSADYVPGYQQAKITCTQCHAMPHPEQHSSEEWPSVITRMEDHIKIYHKQMPSKEGLKSIVEYYVGNSGCNRSHPSTISSKLTHNCRQFRGRFALAT